MRPFLRSFSPRAPGIAAKLFLAMLGVCGIMALGMGLAMRLHFDSDFLNYLGDVEEERLSALALVLADEYAQKGSWHFLSADPKTWRKLVGRHIRGQSREKKEGEHPGSGSA